MDNPETFSFSGFDVKIKKGKDFSRNILKSRLHKMNINFDLNNNDKTYLINLYDKALDNDSNKIKIFDILKSDTEKMGLLTKSKIVEKNNRRYLVPNKYKEDGETPININKNKSEKQLLIKNDIMDENQLYNLNKSKNRNNNSYSSNNTKSNLTNILANQITQNKENNIINAFILNNKNNRHNEIDSEENIGNKKFNAEIDLNNRARIYTNPYNLLNNNKKLNNSQGNLRINKRFFQQDNRNIFNSEIGRYTNNYYNINEKENEKDFIKSNDIKGNNEIKFYNENNNDKYELHYNYENNENSHYSKINNSPKQHQENYLHNNTNICKSFKSNIKGNFKEYIPEQENNNRNIKSLSIPVKNNFKNKNLNSSNRYRNSALKENNEADYLEEEKQDDIQNNYYDNNDKNYIDLLLYILLLIMAALLIYFVLKIIFKVGNTITEAVTESVNVISNPRRLFRDLIWGFIKSILVGILYDYIYITLPMVILSFVIYKAKERFEFKKICKQIIEDVKRDLENKMDKTMSENEIIDTYSKKYNIDKNIFMKKYLKELRNLRKKDHTLKLSQNLNSKGEFETYWDLNH